MMGFEKKLIVTSYVLPTTFSLGQTLIISTVTQQVTNYFSKTHHFNESEIDTLTKQKEIV